MKSYFIIGFLCHFLFIIFFTTSFGGTMSGELVAIMYYDHEHGALAGKSKLEALGIDAFIVSGEKESSVINTPLQEEFGLFTRIEDAVVAREILEETVDDRAFFPGNDL